MLSNRLMGGAAAWVLALGLAVPGYAQVVSSGIRGEVLGSDTGEPVAGATVVITDTRTNARKTSSVGADGFFSASGLDVGGPYTVTVTAPGYKPAAVNDLRLALGEPLRILVPMEREVAAGAPTEKVTVLGRRNPAIDARGVGAQFNQADIRDTVVINNDFKEIINQSPLAVHELAGNNSTQSNQPLSIAGANPRCNSFNVDGVSQGDGFGLNSGGYPTARSPLPYNWTKQVQVAVTPYKVEYNDFCGGVINVVTQTGTNEFHGGMYYNFKDQDLTGKDIGNGTSPFKTDFQEENWGFHLGGPLIKDKLFFFAGYNRILNIGTPADFGPSGSSAPNIVSTVTQAELDQIINIAKTVYGYDPGGTGTSAPEEIKNIIGKVNWNIDEFHRFQYTYQASEGGANQQGSTPSFSTTTGSPQRLALSSTRYFDGENLKSHNFQFFSDWSEDFSTEVKLGRIRVLGNQVPLNGSDMPTIVVQADQSPNAVGTYAGTDGYVIFGPDNSRHFNFLDYTADVAKVTGTYDMGEHVILGGVEHRTLDIFNAFVQSTQGMYRFDCISDGIAGNGNCFDEGVVALHPDSRFGNPGATIPANAITYNNHPSGNSTLAAGIWGYNVTSLYAQDDWQISSDLSVMFGLRYDRFDSKGTINVNPGFLAAYGFDNTKDLEGLDIILPRASFNYDIPAETEDGLSLRVRGGLGRFSGGNPNVWVSNNYSNDGMQQVLLTGNPLGGSGTILGGVAPNILTTTPGGGLSNLEDIHPTIQGLLGALSSNGTVNLLHPSFELPSIWRANIGIDAEIGGYQVTLEALAMEAWDQMYYQDLRMVPITIAASPTGRGPDGRIIYDHITTTSGNPLIRPTTGNDLVLRNADKGEANYLIAGISKNYDLSETSTLGFKLNYVYSNVNDMGGFTSSVAFSNFVAPARTSMNEPELGRSDYERTHMFKGSLSWSEKFFGMLDTRVRLFGQKLSGQGISYTFSSNPFVDNINTGANPGGVTQTYNDNQPTNKALLYIPRTNAAGQVVCGATTALSSDSAVFFDAGFNCAAFNDFLLRTGLIEYAGNIAPRNGVNGPWITRFDMGIEQEVSLFDDHSVTLEFNIFNLSNLVNKKWGLWETAVFQNFQQVVGANYDRETNTYKYNTFTNGTGLQTNRSSSQWQLQIGARYEF